MIFKRKVYIERGRSCKCNLFMVSILVLILLNILVLSGLFASSYFHQGFMKTITGVAGGDQSTVRSTEHEHDLTQLQEGGHPPPEMRCSPSPSKQVTPTATLERDGSARSASPSIEMRAVNVCTI